MTDYNAQVLETHRESVRVVDHAVAYRGELLRRADFVAAPPFIAALGYQWLRQFGEWRVAIAVQVVGDVATVARVEW